MNDPSPEAVREAVRSRYAEIARARAGSASCCDSASCCAPAAPAPPKSAKLGYAPGELSGLPPGADMGLGSGAPVQAADLLPGQTVVDLGSGGGIDCFIAAGKVGPAGRVVGVDMTEDMVDLARGNAQAGGYANVEFRLGRIESLPLPDESADRVVSNCVVNLSPDKPAVFADVFRVLKPGGRMAISDIVALAPLPQCVRDDLDKRCGCVAGAATVDEIREWLEAAGFEDVRIECGSPDESPVRVKGAQVASAMIYATRPK